MATGAGRHHGDLTLMQLPIPWQRFAPDLELELSKCLKLLARKVVTT
jgi:hypothetical protein